jgi:AcrR family transcriptional regulator
VVNGEPQGGLRERKKQRTRAAISDTAIALFLTHGFDNVSVVQVAAAAEVSKRTLFAYFPTKEDLVLHRIADHEQESADVVRARPARESPLDALHQHFIEGLRRRDPITGLTTDPEALAIYHMIITTPSLTLRLQHYFTRSEDALSGALIETVDALRPLTARLAAAQITIVQRTLAEDTSRQLVSGADADRLHPHAVAAANHAFALLGTGLASSLS